jgi:hypothetical protein
VWLEIGVAIGLSALGLAVLVAVSRGPESTCRTERAENDAAWRRRFATHDGPLVSATQLRRGAVEAGAAPTERELMLEANAYATKATERPWRRGRA